MGTAVKSFFQSFSEIPDGTYQKKECLIGERNRLYIFSDGVYEVEKSDTFEDDFTIVEVTFG